VFDRPYSCLHRRPNGFILRPEPLPANSHLNGSAVQGKARSWCLTPCAASVPKERTSEAGFQDLGAKDDVDRSVGSLKIRNPVPRLRSLTRMKTFFQ
jgi:hypothetical protein